MGHSQPSHRNPDVGMLAIVRNRRGVISDVREYDGESGRVHLVRIDYKDEQRPLDEQLLWELEPFKQLLEPNEIPRSADPPMQAEDFDALIRSARWGAISPYLDPDGGGPLDRTLISAPFYGAVQIENYQLIPLLKALRMPRVNLLIADDVGLGKTVEAGLIQSELLVRRRINRVLILTPASLRTQWRDEMWSKFTIWSSPPLGEPGELRGISGMEQSRIHVHGCGLGSCLCSCRGGAFCSQAASEGHRALGVVCHAFL